jgi:hypothetical protein
VVLELVILVVVAFGAGFACGRLRGVTRTRTLAVIVEPPRLTEPPERDTRRAA